MARLNIYKNVFENECESYEYDFTKTLQENVDSWSGNYTDYVECYDPSTGKTFFAPFLDSEEDCAVIMVNGNSVTADYEVQKDDIVNVFYMPQSEKFTSGENKYWNLGSVVGTFTGAIAGILGMAIIAGSVVTGVGWVVPIWAILVGAAVGGVGGYFLGSNINHNDYLKKGTNTSEADKKGETRPDVRGSSNQSLVNNSYPFVIGKHICAPFIIADPYTEYTGNRGEEAWVRTVYCVGYGPLKLTDLRLGDIMLAYNRKQGASQRRTMLTGKLYGHSESGAEADTGDILDIWKPNDISVEILQQVPGYNINYGSIYPDKMTQTEINAAALFINDEDISAQVPKVYKGVSFPTNFRNNGVWFTESCPMEFTINLDAANGLYASRSKTTKSGNDTTSTTEYSRIPLWYAVQWRFYDEGNSSSDSEGNDYNSWNLVTNWNDIEDTEQNPSPFIGVYDSTAMNRDKNAHAGNNIEEKNVDWYSKIPIEYLLTLRNKWETIPKTESDLSVTGYMGIKLIKIGDKVIYNGPANETNYFVGKINSEDSKDNVVYDSVKKILYVDAYNQASSSETITAEWMEDFQYFTPALLGKIFTVYDCYNSGSSRTTRTFTVDKVYVLKKYFTTTKTTKQSISGAWIDRKLINFESLCANNKSGTEDLSGISQTRIRGKVKLTKQQCKEMLNDNNKISGIEVRVIRVSPNYLNETTTTTQSGDDYPKYGSYSYSDMITVSSIVTKSFDREAFERDYDNIDDNSIPPVKIQSESDMKKFTYVAIKAKADTAGNIQGSLDQLTLTAESFSPTWDKEEKKWLPENVHRVEKYWGYVTVNDAQPAVTTPATAPADIDEKFYVYETVDGYKRVVSSNYQGKPDCYDVYTELDDGIAVYLSDRAYRTNNADEIEVSQKDYEEARQSDSGFDWYNEHVGSNFNDLIKDVVFSGENQPELHNGVNTWYLPEVAVKFNDNNVASGFMLAAVGSQNGPVAYGYENINTLSAGDWYEECEAVTDGSTENNEPISIRMEANGYVTQAQKLEVLLAELAATGRAVYAYDEAGHIQPLMDLPTSYPAGVINEQNIITQANAFSYAENPAGLRIEFDDENDGYNRNSFYCWSDGNSLQNYHGQVENYGFKYITNPRQAWSMGRYLLAVRLQQKEALTIKIGREGRLFPILSMVLLQSDELLIGGGSGRIREFIAGIQDGVSKIFGIITDSTFDYTGETEMVGQTAMCKQGVSIFQPKETGNARIVQQRLKLPSDPPIEIDGVQYQMKVGTTNILLFKDPLVRANYSMKIGDIAMFGVMEHISERYKVAKIKPESKGQYTVTLYPYNEDIYEYGKELPKFQTYMTMPKSTSPIFNMSEVPDTIAEKAQKDNELIDYSNNVISIPDNIQITADKNGISISTNKDKITVCDQSFDINITCLKNNEPHAFLIGQITVPQGWTYTAVLGQNKVTFNVPKGIEIKGGNIEIPVTYDDSLTYNGYVDQNGNPIVDQGNELYDTTLLENGPTKVLPITYESNDGGRDLGLVTSAQTIPSTPNLNDYFVWSGNNEEPTALTADGCFYRARLYRYTGDSTYPWETDEDIYHNSAALGEIFSAANQLLNSEDLRNNNLQGWTFIKSLAVCTLFVDYLVANNAFISKLATDILTVGSPLYRATEQKQDAIAQNLGYDDYNDMVAKAQSDGTIIDGGYLRTSLIELETLFAEKIQLKSKTIEGQNVPGAIYGGKYLPNGTINPQSQSTKGVYLDSEGTLKSTNGEFSGVIKNESTTAIPLIIQYSYDNRNWSNTPGNVFYFTRISSDGGETWNYYENDLDFGQYVLISYFAYTNTESEEPSSWTHFTPSNIPNNDSGLHMYLKIKEVVFDYSEEVVSKKDTYRWYIDGDVVGYVLDSNGNAIFNGNVSIGNNLFLSGAIEVTNTKNGIGIHSDNFNNSSCEGFNIAQVGNDSIFKTEAVSAKSISAWKPSNQTFSSLTLAGNNVSVNGFLSFTSIKQINYTGYSSASTFYNLLKDTYDKVGANYLHCTALLKWTRDAQYGQQVTEEYQYLSLTYESNSITVRFGDYNGSGSQIVVTSSGCSMSGGTVNEVHIILFGY